MKTLLKNILQVCLIFWNKKLTGASARWLQHIVQSIIGTSINKRSHPPSASRRALIRDSSPWSILKVHV